MIATLACALLLAAGDPGTAQQEEPRGRYLERPRGPYRGRVIDAETKAPLRGAVVVAHWWRDRIMPLHLSSEPHAVREVLTDENGQFLLDATDVELTASRRVHRPTFTVFMPGYGSFPRLQVAPKGVTDGFFEGAGGTVELPRLKTREARLRHLHHVSPAALSEKPFEDIPELMRLLNQEHVAVGLDPYRPAVGRE